MMAASVMTTRGMQEPEMAQIDALIARALRAQSADQSELDRVMEIEVALTKKFVVHTHLT